MQITGGFTIGSGWTFSSVSSPSAVDYLAVAGGGGGGGGIANYSTGGGGGAGGLLSGSTSVSATTTYTVTVGAGGNGATAAAGTVGSNSVFSVITAIGGGNGSANGGTRGATGGSGGGGSGNVLGTYGLGTAGQGNNGGDPSTGDPYPSGGGGGAGAVGGTGAGTTPGVGGAGVVTTLYGSNLGSISFNGTSQYLTAPSSSALQGLASGNMTIEFWINFNSAWGTNLYNPIQKGRTGPGDYEWGVYLTGSGGNAGVISWQPNNGTGIFTTISNSSSVTILPNQWYHVAISVSGTTVYFFLNGVAVGTASVTLQSFVSSGALSITNNNTGTNTYFPGYMSNIRIVKGVAVYTSAFTPPTNPLTVTQSANFNGSPSAAITGTQTSLLLNMSYGSGYLTDSSTNNATITNIGAAVSSVSNPFYTIAYAGGGGGAKTQSGAGSAGGLGGGGAGGTAGGSGVAGTTNTGGGGGAGGGTVSSAGTGAAGGSGIVIIRYPDSYSAATIYDGATYTVSGGYRIYTYTTSGRISWAPVIPVDYLVVAGGGGTSGGGAEPSGGGGAGGLLSGTLSGITTSSSLTVTVGAGGASNSGTGQASPGANSSLTGVTTVIGGGKGGTSGPGAPGGAGGSGGGAGAWQGGAGGTPTSGQGNAGGSDTYYGTPYASAGGGGAGTAGGSITSSGATSGGAGGNGYQWVDGNYYAGGGGGTCYAGGTYGAGGTGGGGRGGDVTSPYANAASGTTNTGGGGGGAAYSGTGGAGGSGVVIVRYPDSFALASSTTGSPTITTAGGYRTYKFTASGSITF